jgi:hypothetical protein
MRPLIDVASQQDFQALVTRFYDISEVHGFALDIDLVYLALLQGQYGPGQSLNRALEKGIIPAGWAPHCSARHVSPNLSPIFVVIYISGDPDKFRSTWQVPNSISSGHEVRIEQRGPFVAAADYGRHRPLIGGISVGNSACASGGTLGGFLKQDGTADPEVLSCNHVLVDTAGVDIVQQSTDHGGHVPAELIGTLSYVVPITPPAGFAYASPYNKIDAGLAKVDVTTTTATSGIRKLTASVTSIASTHSIELGDPIVFVGKESDDQRGFVNRFISRLKVSMGTVLHNFGDVFEIKSTHKIYSGSFAQKGDSGSWVMREVDAENNELYGLLFAIDLSANEFATCCFVEYAVTELNRMASATYVPY